MIGVGVGVGIGFTQSAAPAKTPASILGSQLASWHRADLGTNTTTNGAAISSWADQSGKGDANRNLANASGTTQPSYTASNSAFNNKPTIHIDNVNGHYKHLISGTWSAALTTPWAYFLVASIDTTLAGNQYWCTNGTTANGNLFRNSSSLKYSIVGPIHEVDSTTALTRNAATVIGGLFNGASSKTYVNAKTADVTGTADTPSISSLCVGDYGASLDASFGVQLGDLAEILVCSSPTTQQISDLFDYFHTRYAVTIGP